MKNSNNNITRSEFKIPKMDCMAEEQLIRTSLEDREGVQVLEFNLAERILIVWHIGDIDTINNRLAGLKLGATLLETKEKADADLPSQDSVISEREHAKVLWILLSINALMFVVEFVSGWLFDSTGLIADSLDMLADAAVYSISLLVVGKAVHHKLKAAHISGWLQLALAMGAMFEVGRRFVYGSEPNPPYMIGIATIALIANVFCLWLITKHKDQGAHMKASWIFSANDVIVNLGVIVAGFLVSLTGSRFPDLIIGTIIVAVVFLGSVRILKLKK